MARSKRTSPPQFANKVLLDDSWQDPGWYRMSSTLTRDPALSTEAVGAVARMVDNTDGFSFTSSFLQKKLGWGRDKLRKHLRELELAGYLIPERDRDEHGQLLDGTTYRLFPRPNETAIELARERHDRRAVVSAGRTQLTENTSPGRKQAKQGVSAGRDQPTENTSPGLNRENDSVSAGRDQPTENQALVFGTKHRSNKTQIEITEHTHQAPSSTNAPVAESENKSVCVSAEAERTMGRLLTVSVPEAPRGRLSQVDRAKLAGLVDACLRRGHEASTIERRVRGLCNDATLYPMTHLTKALTALEGEPPAPSRPAAPAAPQTSSAASRTTCRRTDCVDGQLVCGSDCSVTCGGDHDPVGTACLECQPAARATARGRSSVEGLIAEGLAVTNTKTPKQRRVDIDNTKASKQRRVDIDEAERARQLAALEAFTAN